MQIIPGASLLSVIISSMADWAGKTLGKVRIDNLVARGGMAEVYTGTHESFGLVAVKVMRGLLDRDSDQLARFKREAEVVEELRHPNIVQMFDYAVVDETPCIIMEYIPGPSLADYLKHLDVAAIQGGEDYSHITVDYANSSSGLVLPLMLGKLNVRSS